MSSGNPNNGTPAAATRAEQERQETQRLRQEIAKYSDAIASVKSHAMTSSNGRILRGRGRGRPGILRGRGGNNGRGVGRGVGRGRGGGVNQTWVNPALARQSIASSSTAIVGGKRKPEDDALSQPTESDTSNATYKRQQSLVNLGGSTYRRTQHSLVAIPACLNVERTDQGRTQQVLRLEDGTEFLMDTRGQKLVRKGLPWKPKQPQQQAPSSVLPKKVEIQGVAYVRTKRGNLVRASLLERRSMEKQFSVRHLQRSRQDCLRYNRYGQCKLGIKCRRIHNPARIRICPLFLHNKCTHTESLPDFLLSKKPNLTYQNPRQLPPQPLASRNQCRFSHTLDPLKLPLCNFFAKGGCAKVAGTGVGECMFPHVKMNPMAEVCVEFVRGVYCERGKACMRRHVFECPQWVHLGACPLLEKGRKCSLLHPKRFQKKEGGEKEPGTASEKTDDITTVEGSTSKVIANPSTSTNTKQPHYWNRARMQSVPVVHGEVSASSREQDIEDGQFVPFDLEEEEEEAEEQGGESLSEEEDSTDSSDQDDNHDRDEDQNLDEHMLLEHDHETIEEEEEVKEEEEEEEEKKKEKTENIDQDKNSRDEDSDTDKYWIL